MTGIAFVPSGGLLEASDGFLPFDLDIIFNCLMRQLNFCYESIVSQLELLDKGRVRGRAVSF